MKKFYGMLVMFVLISASSIGQNTFSFTCARDTVLNNCAITCITLKAKIPDIRSSTNTYVVNPLSGADGCFRNYVDPGTPGTPTNLVIDDRYSALIALPFNFPFFGSIYNSLVASANGFLSFDASMASLFSHWMITANLPSTTYDRALIMGPMHDLDPSINTSPTRRIKYDVSGAAPNRRWTLSFFKVPLFSTTCNTLFENTHQIVLYEGLGLVEVLINSKQQCITWNSGRAIVGMQNFDRTSGIMAPGRTATSPPWGSVNMNESWRFIPATGPTLFRKVELFTLAGAFVATGDTVSIGNNTFDVSFPNVCPTTTTSYIVRSEYEAFNNPALRVVGTDTIRVVRGNAITLSAGVTNNLCNGNTNGSIILTASNGSAPYQYSIDNGVTFQASNTFSNLPAGVYNVRVKDNSICSKDTVITITQPAALTTSVVSTGATCAVLGTVTVIASGGTAPYTYSTNGTTFQASNVLSLESGQYTITIKDANGCLKTNQVNVTLTNDLVLQVRGDTTICAGGTVVLNTTSTATSYLWTPATGLSNPTISSPAASPLTLTTYTLVATLGQCTKTASVTVNVVQQVFVSAGVDQIIIAGDATQLNGAATNATSLMWTVAQGLPATSLSATNILNPVAKPATTTLYTLTGRNANGCFASDDVLITVIPYCIKVKNAFSPNGDGINDVWAIYDQYDCLKNISLGVFNRYGNKVYESKDYRNTWDGTYKGKPVPDGTYYSVISFTMINGKVIHIKTDLTVIR